MPEQEPIASPPPANPPINACNVYVQFWVDVNGAVAGPNPPGIYAVDDQSPASQSEGTLALSTACKKGDTIGFSAFSVDPTVPSSSVTVAAMGDSQAWGFGAPPRSDGKGNYTGQVANDGVFPYEVTVNTEQSGGQTIHLTQLHLNVAPA